MTNVENCRECPLRKGCRAPVPGYGPLSASIMVVGEAPGRNEDRAGIPFVGGAGQELAMLLAQAGLDYSAVFITNIVKCWPGLGNPDPPLESVIACSHWLEGEITVVQPDVIVAAGLQAALWFGVPRDVLMEDIHGQPFYWKGIIILPIYHPAAMLHNSANIARSRQDMKVLRSILDGTFSIPMDEFPSPLYSQIRDFALPPDVKTLALDTEDDGTGELLCLSLSYRPGESRVIWKDDVPSLSWLFADPTLNWVVHNGLYDLRVMRRSGFSLAGTVQDTMIMAYVLQKERISLKWLARQVGMSMRDYSDMVGPAHIQVSVDYLRRALELEGVANKPTPVSKAIYADGLATYRVRQPQSLLRKIKAILHDLENGKDIDPRERWLRIDERRMVERIIGPMPRASLANIPRPEAIHYSARDADATLRLSKILLAELEEQGLMLNYLSDMAIVPMVAAMMDRGMPVSRPDLEILYLSFTERIGKAELDCWIAGGQVFNPNSPDQVAKLLYEGLNLPSGKKTKSGVRFSTDDEHLKKLAKGHAVVPAILEYRRMAKMRDAFVGPLYAYAEQDSRIHCDLSITRVATNRLAASNPNLLAMPVRHGEGREVRNCFVARPDYVFLSVDESQLEMRLMAHVSHDEALIRTFLGGGDVHTQNASELFRISASQVDELRHRYPAKRIGFGVIYGMQAEGLLADLEENVPDIPWTLAECRLFLRRYFELHPGIAGYQDQQHQQVRKQGFVTDIFGRRRNIPEVFCASRRIISEGLRKAVNTPIQMSAATMMKIYMAEVWKILEDTNWYERDLVVPLLQIHDDLLFEVHEDVLEAFAPQVISIMEQGVHLLVPMIAEAKIGKRWGDIIKWKK